jgi:hypothetical protein
MALTLTGVGCDDDDPIVGDPATVDVVLEDQTVTIDLGELDAVTIPDGEGYVLLADVVDAASLGVAIDELEFDFEGGDGFLASSSSNCVDVIPLAGTALSQGYIQSVTRDLAWDESLGLPSCTNVDDTARILAGRVGMGMGVEVVYGETSANVGLGSLNVVEIDGEEHVNLMDIITSASLGVLTSSLGFDFEAGDGYRPSSSGNCAGLTPIAGDQLEHGFVNVANRNLSWADDAALPGCMNVDDLTLIEATDL